MDERKQRFGTGRLLRRSLKALVSRFPDVTTGLNGWETELLKYARDKGPIVARVIGYTMTHDMSYPDWVGDAYLFDRLRRLADSVLPHPFLSLTGSTVSMRGAEVTLTETGTRALGGDANFVRLNGIDDWIGGIHLASSEGNVWFRSDDNLMSWVKVRPNQAMDPTGLTGLLATQHPAPAGHRQRVRQAWNSGVEWRGAVRVGSREGRCQSQEASRQLPGGVDRAERSTLDDLPGYGK